jgi:hypothetical protein
MMEADETVAGALNEMAQFLREKIKLPVSIERLGDESDLLKKVYAILNEQSYTFNIWAAKIYDSVFSPKMNKRLLIYCRPDSYLAEAARRKKDSAQWGATCDSFSAAYPPKDQLNSKFTIWHETVHLLLRRPDNSDECYEPYYPYPPKGDCTCDTCIMRYKPNEKWDGKLSMCDKIIGFLKELSKNCR